MQNHIVSPIMLIYGVEQAFDRVHSRCVPLLLRFGVGRLSLTSRVKIFGSDRGPALLAELLLNIALSQSKEIEFAFESQSGGYRAVSVSSVEARFFAKQSGLDLRTLARKVIKTTAPSLFDALVYCVRKVIIFTMYSTIAPIPMPT